MIKSLQLEQMDVETTLLHGDLIEDIYVYVSTGKLHGDGGGQTHRMSTQEKSIWLENVMMTLINIRFGFTRNRTHNLVIYVLNS